MDRHELIRTFIEFFKKHSHVEIPSASLIPQNDPTVLFTTAGMHPLVPYLLGQKHPLGTRLVDVQKCIRTQDIDEVGDATHHTFFEMLGNWSLGDYWKKESIKYSFEFLTKELKIPKDKLAVTVFKGDNDAPKDMESFELWKSQGIPEERIAFLPKEDNWWGPAGQVGPCGPDTEIFYYVGKKAPKTFDPKDKQWVEIWNNVFMEYEKKEDGKYHKAKQQNVDTGMGVERTLAALNKLEDNYLTDSFLPIIKEIEHISGKKYKGNERTMRIIADHIRAATFILGDEVSTLPSNIGQGYVLRRLIRRAVHYGKKLGVSNEFTHRIAEVVIEHYKKYPELSKNKSVILENIHKEEIKFNTTLEKAIKEFEKFAINKKITGEEGFLLFQSYGLPIEMTAELAKEKNVSFNSKEAYAFLVKHQELSRSTSAGMFKSGLADNSEQTTRLHTATHMLNEALRKVLGSDVKQRGSNITPERLRFDFNFSRKVTEEELKKIETLVNEKIKEHLEVTREEVTFDEAVKQGAQAEFGHKYPERVSMYTIGPKKGWFSKEICTGPHVKNTRDVGKFKIIKEEGVAAGIRRIKATVS